MSLQTKSKGDIFTIALFIIYALVLVWILLFKMGVQFSYMPERRVNFIPFREAILYNSKPDLPEIILNVIIFVPLGIYAAILFRSWNFGKHLGFFLMTSFLFEALQFLLKIGAFDITDILTNTFGGIIGLLVFKGTERLFDSGLKAQKFMNGVCALGTAVVVLLLTLLKWNMLPIRYR